MHHQATRTKPKSIARPATVSPKRHGPPPPPQTERPKGDQRSCRDHHRIHPHGEPQANAGRDRIPPPSPPPKRPRTRDPSGGRSEGKEGEKEPAFAALPSWCPWPEAAGARLPANAHPPHLTEPARGTAHARDCREPAPRPPPPAPAAALYAPPGEGRRRGVTLPKTRRSPRSLRSSRPPP